MGKRAVWVLIDPDKKGLEEIEDLIYKINSSDVISTVLCGGSFMFAQDFEDKLERIKTMSKKPVVLFPGNPNQVSKHADALLFLSVISGRNPETLIGHHISAAPAIKKLNIETIPTGYILIDGGNSTAVSYITQSLPIPSKSSNIAAATAIAGEMLGMRLIYLEAGSGASKPVPSEMVKKVRKNITCPLIVGGGVRSVEQCDEIFEAGADVIVIGSKIEESERFIFELDKHFHAVNSHN